jgi:hypothetical protein
MLWIGLTVCLMGALTVPMIGLAQEEEQEMPPMGPPEEMKQIASMAGVYDVEFKFRMDPNQDWTTTKVLATIKMVLDGAAQQMDWQGEMMGMKFSGLGLTAYNRETKKWQNTWVDNMSGQISISEGDLVDGKMVLSGVDMMQGMKVHSRHTWYNMTDKGFEWSMEMSMDGGENFVTSGTATYTKR